MSEQEFEDWIDAMRGYLVLDKDLLEEWKDVELPKQLSEEETGVGVHKGDQNMPSTLDNEKEE